MKMSLKYATSGPPLKLAPRIAYEMYVARARAVENAQKTRNSYRRIIVFKTTSQWSEGVTKPI